MDFPYLTIHSQAEELNDHIPSMDTVVNRFKPQIIITDEFLEEREEKFGKRRIYVKPNLSPQNLVKKLKTFINTGRIAIYTQIPDHDFNIIQQILIKEFPNTKFIKCNYFAQDIDNEEELIKAVSIQHKQLKHPGIIALYQDLKFKIYSAKLKITIIKITNNYDICCRGKYDRQPIKAKYFKTDMPTDMNQIIHIDVYTNTKQKFLTFI